MYNSLIGDATKLVKGKRNIHKGGISFFGPRKISTKIRYLYDKKLRVTKTFIKLDYNLQKLFSNVKDSLQFNSKLLKKSVKTSQRIRFNSQVSKFLLELLSLLWSRVMPINSLKMVNLCCSFFMR